MRIKIKRISEFLFLKNIAIRLPLFLGKLYKFSNSSKNNTAFGKRNIYRSPFEWITVDGYGAESNANFESPDTFAGLNKKIDFIYSAHVFEHISDHGIKSKFEKSQNNLNAGCILRVGFPDVKVVIDDIFKKRTIVFRIIKRMSR